MAKKKRDQVPHPNLVKRVNSRVRQEFIDFDYLSKLNKDELDWLNKFMGEYNNSSIILDENNELDPTKNLHQKPEHKKELYDANNHRNVDLWGNQVNKVGVTKVLSFEDSKSLVENELYKKNASLSVEDALIEVIDERRLAVSDEVVVNLTDKRNKSNKTK